MKKFLLPILIFIFMGFLFLNPAWASYTNHTVNGEWIYNNRVDDFTPVYCDLGLIQDPDRRYGSLTEVTLSVQCTSAGYNSSYDDYNWTLRIYAGGRYDNINGANPSSTEITSVSGAGRNEIITTTIAIPNAGYNGLGFCHRGDDDEETYKIIVSRIKYRVYKVDGFNLSLSGENRYVKLNVNYTPVSNFKFVAVREPDRSRDVTFSGSSCTDSEVAGETYYTYTLYSGFRIDTAGGGDILTSSIRVPSDATEVKEVIDDVKSSADAAKASADAGRIDANAAKNQTWYSGGYGGASESVANTAGYIRNTQLPSLENRLTNLATQVTNIQNNIGTDITPPFFNDLTTVSGARATSGSSIELIVDVVDNVSTVLVYSVNGGSFSTLPANRKITVPVGSGSISVTVRDEAGNSSIKTISIRRL